LLTFLRLDHSVNDSGEINDYGMSNFEAELRSILLRTNRPLVIVVELFELEPITSKLYGAGGQQVGPHTRRTLTGQNDVARYYDTPFLSLRNSLLPEMIAHPYRIPDFFGRVLDPANSDIATVDVRHVSNKGHYAVAAMIAHYLWTEMVDMYRLGLGESEGEDPHASGQDAVILGEESVMVTDKAAYLK
jgi:hypothetical protein